MSAEARVTFRLPDGRTQTLIAGDLIGRMARAELRIDDPRISEAHALVSLRGTELKLVALRGRMSVDGRQVQAVALSPGLRVVLAGFSALVVEALALPAEVFALTIDDGVDAYGPFAVAGVSALHLGPPPRLAAGFDPDADAVVWGDDRGLTLRAARSPDGHDLRLAAGGAARLGAVTVRADAAPLSSLASDTTLDHGHFDVALTLVLHYDTVHVRPASGPAVVFDGLPARLLSELAALRTPVSWQSLARLLWDEDDDVILRPRWDQAVSRVRRRLRAGRVRGDLLRSTGAGLVELNLGPTDAIEDHS